MHLVRGTLARFLGDRCPQLAAAVSYHVLFSLFPLAIVVAAVFGEVATATGIRTDTVDAIVGSVPLTPDGADRLRTLLEGATRRRSTVGLAGVAALVWSASGMMAAVRTGLNSAWDVEEARPFLRGKLVDVALVAAAALGVLLSLSLTLGVRAVAGRVTRLSGIDVSSSWIGLLTGIVLPVVTVVVVVFCLYRFVPAARVRTRHAAIAAVLVAAAFVGGENLFALYVANVGHYNTVYGSLGGVIVFMLFVYLSALVFLLGAEATSQWVRTCRAVAAGEVEQAGPPFSRQLSDFVKGLWVRSG